MSTRARWPAGTREELAARLDYLARDAGGTWSFAVAEGGTVAAVQPDFVHPAASTIKVPLLIAVLEDVARGACELSEPLSVPEQRTPGSGVLRMLPSVSALSVEEMLELMITISDNTATNVLIDRIGLDALAGRFRELGLARTRLRRHMLDHDAREAGRDNVASAGELATLLDQLCTTDLLRGDLRSVAMRALAGQQINDRMPSRLGPDTTCLHKTGELVGIRHDVGILRFDGREIAFAAMGSGLPDAGDGTGSGPVAAVIGRAARTVVDLAKTAEGTDPVDPSA